MQNDFLPCGVARCAFRGTVCQSRRLNVAGDPHLIPHPVQVLDMQALAHMETAP